MDQHWRAALEGLRESTDHLIDANEAIAAASAAQARAGVAVQKTIDALMAAHEEHEDLRVTVARLEGLVLELVERARHNGGA